MIDVEIPGGEPLRLEHLVLDYNGTLARDGALLPGVGEALVSLAGALTIHVVTADTFGSARDGLRDLPCRLVVLPPADQAEAKAAYVRELGSSSTACVGNGRNDRLMLREAGLGMAVLEAEGTSGESLLAARVVCRSIGDALGLLLHPLRLTATLRG